VIPRAKTVPFATVALRPSKHMPFASVYLGLTLQFMSTSEIAHHGMARKQLVPYST
jgi:hypothetical protein